MDDLTDVMSVVDVWMDERWAVVMDDGRVVGLVDPLADLTTCNEGAGMLRGCIERMMR